MFVLERETWKIIKFAVTRTGSSKYQFIFPLSYAIPVTLMEITTPGETYTGNSQHEQGNAN